MVQKRDRLDSRLWNEHLDDLVRQIVRSASRDAE
jgi:hypothetical protein